MRFVMLILGLVALLMIPGPVLVSRAVASDLTTCNKPMLENIDESISACTRVINAGHMNAHNFAITYTNRGNGYIIKKDPDRAIADFNQALQLDPKYGHAFTGLGIAYNVKKDFDRAISDLDRAIQLEPQYSNAFAMRGDAYLGKHDYEGAMSDFNQAIRLDPKKGSLFDYRGNVYFVEGEYDRAVADYTEAITLNPKDADAYNYRGNTYRIKGDYDRAIAEYDQAIQINPKGAGSFFNRGVADLYAGALPKALADFNQSNALSPKFAYAALWLDIADKRSDLQSQLLEASKQIDMTNWPAPVIRLYLGQMTPESVLAAADDPDVKTKKGHVCEANFYAGELSLQEGKKNEATRLFRLAAESCPKEYIPWFAANAELKALGVAP
jgi:lipoprotein NlpI